MNRLFQKSFWFAFFAAQFFVLPLFAENSAIAHKPFPPANMPPLPKLESPVNFFRQLLVMSPRDRENFLTNRPPEIRARILAKVKEYLALDPNERELRLRATELQWYLMPFLRDSPTNRAEMLAQVPDDLRDLVKARLDQWDILPPPLQQEFLENTRALQYFANVDALNNVSRSRMEDADQTRWNSLPESERQKITAQFNQFFELTPDEKQKTLNTLSDAERAQMEKTLQSFDKLPPLQRRECVHAFTKFAEMSPQERAAFLQNAERWSQLSPKERQTWRDLVAQVPQWPPLPQTFIMPPLPPKNPPRVHALVATNLN
jgi:hypothetical protein